jgi:RNA polymerase sigma-70 factor (ECF subfamily)
VPEREDAEDLTADVFVKLWKLRANLQTIKNIEAFLYITGRNACLDFLRHIQRQNMRQKDLIYTLLQEPEEGVLDEDVKTLVLQAIHAAIEKLPRSTRNVFKMAYLDGMSNSEIAAALDINNQSVRNYKLRAVKTLRIALLNRNMLVGAFITVYCNVLRMFE